MTSMLVFKTLEVRKVLKWIDGYLERVKYSDLLKENKKMSVTDKIIAYEEGELSENEVIDLFAELIRTGLAWSLQGSYGRTATMFIDEGIISQTGEILEGYA